MSTDSPQAPTPVHGLENACRNCERRLDSEVARVIGDNDGCVDTCGECRPGFESTVQAVKNLREQRSGGGLGGGGLR